MDRFARQIEALTRKITQLRQQTAAGTTPPPVLLEQALGQLQDSIEELHTAQEELLQQHAELQDTREQVEAERQSYHELFDYAPDAYLVTDLSGMIRAANRAAAQMCGLDQRRLFGKPLATCVVQKQRQDFRYRLSRIPAESASQQAAAPLELETYLQRHDGTRFLASLSVTVTRGQNGEPIGLRWLIRDISERMRQAEAQRLQLAAIVEASDDAIIGKTLEGIITSWNEGATQLYGYTGQEVLGRSISLLIPPDREQELPYLLDRLRRGERIAPFETVRVRKDGTRIAVSLRLSPITTSTGEIIGSSAIARDITEYKHSEEKMQQLQTATEQRRVILETAGRVALDILSSRTGVEALRHIAEAARMLTHARYAALGVANAEGGLMEFATSGLTAAEEAAIGARPRGLGILGLLLQRTEPLRIQRLSEHPASVGFPSNHPPMQSFLGVPIRQNGNVIGSLYLTDKEEGEPFTEADELAVEALGAYAAVAIHNLHLLSRQRALVSGLINAQEEERRAVAYDLHDGLTQFVMGAHSHLQSFRQAYESDLRERAERELDQGLRYLKEAVVESRRLINGLRSLTLEEMGLAGALDQLLTEEKQRAGWENADFLHNIAGRRFDKSLETTVYRVAQEALTNARKHASASRVYIGLLVTPDKQAGQERLTLEVRDWGSGFLYKEKLGDYSRVGLQGMAERVNLMGGHYQLQTAPGEGTVVRAEFPILGVSEADRDQ